MNYSAPKGIEDYRQFGKGEGIAMIGRWGKGCRHALDSAGFVVLVLQISLFLSLLHARPPEVRLTGELAILAIDQKDQSGRWKSSKLPILVGADGQITQLEDPSNLFGRYRTGTSVEVAGVRSGQKLLATSVQPIDGSLERGLPSGVAVPPPSIRGQTTLVALVNYADNPARPFMLADVRNAVMDAPDSANKFILESSLGAVWLDCDFLDWRTLPGKQADYFG